MKQTEKANEKCICMRVKDTIIFVKRLSIHNGAIHTTYSHRSVFRWSYFSLSGLPRFCYRFILTVHFLLLLFLIVFVLKTEKNKKVYVKVCIRIIMKIRYFRAFIVFFFLLLLLPLLIFIFCLHKWMFIHIPYFPVHFAASFVCFVLSYYY